MKLIYYIIFVFSFSLFAKTDNDKNEYGVSELMHSFSITYETYMGYRIVNDEELIEDDILNTSLLQDNPNILGFGLRYSLSMGLSESNYENLPFFGVGSEVFFDFLLDYQYSDLSREAFTYGIIPYVRFLFFFKAGYGFGFINFREYTDFYGGETNVYSLHQGINFYHFGLDIPIAHTLYANASLDIAENNMQFLQKWEIIRFRLGVSFRM